MKSPATSSSSSSSAAAASESSMDDHTSNRRHLSPKSTSLTTATRPLSPEEADQIDGDPAVWASFSQNFRQVQSVLDRNRVLIQQVNENHQSKTHDNMVKNVELIQEINGNISKVVSLYSNLSNNFTSVCQQQRDSKSSSEGKQ